MPLAFSGMGIWQHTSSTGGFWSVLGHLSTAERLANKGSANLDLTLLIKAELLSDVKIVCHDPETVECHLTGH